MMPREMGSGTRRKKLGEKDQESPSGDMFSANHALMCMCGSARTPWVPWSSAFTGDGPASSFTL